MGIVLAADHHVKGGRFIGESQMLRRAVCAGLEAEGEHGVMDALDRVHGTFVVGIDHHITLLRHQLGKLVERVLHVVQVLEKVQVVSLHVEDHGHSGEEAEEGVAVFTGLHDDGVAMAHPVAGVEQRQCAADHHCGILLGSQENVGAHGGGGGLSVGAGNAKGIAVALHDGAPGLSPLKDRDAPGDGAGDLRVFIVDGGGTDHQVAAPQIVRAVPDGDMNAHGAQVSNRFTFLHVRALDLQAHALEHLCQGTHGDAADAH